MHGETVEYFTLTPVFKESGNMNQTLFVQRES